MSSPEFGILIRKLTIKLARFRFKMDKMKNFLLFILLIYSPSGCFSQPTDPHPIFNFDFELQKPGLPNGWLASGDESYLSAPDSINVQHGRYAQTINSDKGGGFKALSFILPANYPGKKITLSGYLKTENVSDGWAGLWMRIDPQVAFDNMQKKGITGTTDWTPYEITLDMDPTKTEQIVIGALLVGKGKMWADNLKVTIDGVPLEDIKPLEKKTYPADQDTTFDTGSTIQSIVLDQEVTNKLKTLGLTWGFLKYYHPAIARGEVNWDYELFRWLPKILAAKDPKSCDAIYVDWINQLGKFEIDNKKDTTRQESANIIKPDLDWIDQSHFSPALTELLTSVKNAKRTDDHYYIGLIPGVGNPQFKNEKGYGNMKFPDTGFRLLALFRYWNIIQYYFPYKDLIEEDWKNVLGEFIPIFINASDEKKYTLAALTLIARVHDTHANIWGGNQVLSNWRGKYLPAPEIKFIENKAVVTGYYDDAIGKANGLQVGDIVLKVNGIPVDTIIKEKLKTTPASNYPTQLRSIAENLLRTNDTIVDVDYMRNDKMLHQQLTAYPFDKLKIYGKYQKQDTCCKFIKPTIAYLYPGSFKNAYLPVFWNNIKTTSGLIIDLRCYPSDFIVFTLSQHLMPTNTPFVKFTRGSITEPGLFVMGQPLSVGEDNNDYYKGKVVILVNETTQSQAEYTTMALRIAPKATVIGSTTAGADGNVSQFYLPGGFSTMISGIGVYYPDGQGTQRVGIIADIPLSPTIEGIKNGQDELLEKAIEIIEKE